MRKWIVPVIGGFVLALVFLVLIGGPLPRQQSSSPTVTPVVISPMPPPSPPTVPLAIPTLEQKPTPLPLQGTLTYAEEEAVRQSNKATLEAKGIYPLKDSGPETAGSLLTIAGKPVQLPPDAFVDAVITAGQCVIPPPCPKLPAWIIRRGHSSIVVDRLGNLFDEQTTPGEQEAFRFLKDALQ